MLLAMCDDVESICLVRECREMEEHFGTHFTSDIIKKEITCKLKEMKRTIIKADKKMTIKKIECEEKAPMIAKVAEFPGWAKLWDHTLDLGWKVVQGLKMLSRAMSHHGKGERLCYLCEADTENLVKEETLLDYILTSHNHELHLEQVSLLDISNLIVMLSDLHLDILKAFFTTRYYTINN